MSADVKAAAHQAFVVVMRSQAGKLERPGHFVAAEQSQFDPLTVMLDAVRRSLQVMVQQER